MSTSIISRVLTTATSHPLLTLFICIYLSLVLSHHVLSIRVWVKGPRGKRIRIPETEEDGKGEKGKGNKGKEGIRDAARRFAVPPKAVHAVIEDVEGNDRLPVVVFESRWSTDPPSDDPRDCIALAKDLRDLLVAIGLMREEDGGKGKGKGKGRPDLPRPFIL
ncbi:hypothetical protein HK104_007652, partial [Borealophlyctis nickersoniae]